VSEIKSENEHTSRQRKRRNQMKDYAQSDRRLLKAIRIAANLTENETLRADLVRAADRLKCLLRNTV
jgi:hypothetical protein